MTSYTQAEATAIVVQLIIVVFIVRRSYRMAQGVPYSLARLLLIPILILALWAASELGATLLIPWAFPYLLVADTAILVATAALFTGVAEGMTQVTRGPSGAPSFTISFSLAAIYLATFLVRIGLAAALFPSSLEIGAPVSGYPPYDQQLVLAAIDAVYSLSAGLLVGRAIGIYRKVARAPAAAAPG